MITKKYNKKIILNNIDFKINTGCSLIVGKNGSGKTTLLKILSGLIVRFDGDYKYNNNASLLLDANCLFSLKSGEENLRFFLSKEEYRSSLEWSLFFGINMYLQKKVKTYSNGMKKKLMLVIAISKRKDILLLDEPTTSLDYEGIILLKEALIKIKKSKKIIIASHDSSMLDFSCIDFLYILKDKELFEKKFDSNFLLYKIKTKNAINFNFQYARENDYYIFKVFNDQEDIFFEKLSKFVPIEISKISSTDFLFKEVFENEKNV